MTTDTPNFRRRRLIVGGVALLAVAVLLLVVVSLVSGRGPTSREAVTIPDEAKTQLAGDGPRACSNGVLRVDGHTDQLSYGAGEYPRFSLSVENTGTEPCVASLGTDTMSFIVIQDGDEIWNSTHCQVDPVPLEVVLEPQTPLATDAIEWDRTESAPDTCDEVRQAVFTNEYGLRVAVAGVESEELARFSIE